MIVTPLRGALTFCARWAIAAIALPALAQAPKWPPDCEAPGNTRELNQCAALALEKAEQGMKRYFDASVARWEHSPRLAAEIADSQRHWQAFKTSHCAAVFELNAGGSIRVAAITGCHVALTRTRTRELWATWLQHADSTPPVLPEPPADCDAWSGWGSGPCFRRRP